MYGDGKVAAHPKDAQAFAAEATKDPAVVAARFHAARALLEANPHVDATRIAAIGYCFGGGVVLDMVRSGEPLAAVATFHGALGTEHPAAEGAVKAPILVMTGSADEFVPLDQVKQFEAEMKAAHADVQVIVYPGARHSFTNPEAGTHGMPQLAYNAEAARKSWASMLAFFKRRLR
jgi:dienelactone hydrolase